jgi:hypothetical protein
LLMTPITKLPKLLSNNLKHTSKLIINMLNTNNKTNMFNKFMLKKLNKFTQKLNRNLMLTIQSMSSLKFIIKSLFKLKLNIKMWKKSKNIWIQLYKFTKMSIIRPSRKNSLLIKMNLLLLIIKSFHLKSWTIMSK